MSTLRIIHISGRPYREHQGHLDPVTVFLEDFEPGRGQLTAICWGRAWTCFWGAMGNGSTLETFILGACDDYIVGKLMLPYDVMLKRVEKREERWLTEIVGALKEVLRKPQEIAA